mmetsp:Transcript_98166/g.225262  ORF Transcript_98166/g.225262 Transcript_98166/m.225262 type:complete len:353 (+) Transcript_98166:146-1204(+)
MWPCGAASPPASCVQEAQGAAWCPDTFRFSGAAAAVVGPSEGRVILILFGATDNYAFTNSGYVLDPRTHAITPISALDLHKGRMQKRWLHTASVVGEQLLVIGGQSELGEPMQEIWSAGWVSEWSSGKVVPFFQWHRASPKFGCAGHTASVVGDEVVLFGGLDGREESNLVHSVSPLQQSVQRISTRGAPPSPRWCHTSAVGGGSVVVFGGWQRPSVFLNDTWVLDTSSWQWSEMAPAGVRPCPRTQSAMWQLEEGMFCIFGGAAHNTTDSALYGDRVLDMDDMHVLDMHACTWIPCLSKNTKQRGGVNAVATVGKEVYVIGGMHSDAGADMPTFVGDISLVHTPPAAWRGL